MRSGLSDKLFHQYTVIAKVALKRCGFSLSDNLDNEETLMKFFNYKRRTISVRPRKVLQSKELSCPKHLVGKFECLKKIIENGKNLNIYQSFNINNLNKHDYLLYDWGIYHLHFDSLNDPNFNKKNRSDELLFIYFTDEIAYLIDIKTHANSFTNKDLLEIIDSNWSYILEPYIVKGVIGLANEIDEEGRGALRKACINIPTVLDNGKILMSSLIGGGIVCSGDSGYATDNLIKISRNFDSIANFINIINSRQMIDEEISFIKPNLATDEHLNLYLLDENCKIFTLDVILEKAKDYEYQKFYELQNKKNKLGNQNENATNSD